MKERFDVAFPFLLIGGAIAFAISIAILGAIDNAVVHQPKVAQGLYTYAHDFKGTILYITYWQNLAYAVFMPIMIAGWAAAATAIGGVAYLNGRDRKRARDE